MMSIFLPHSQFFYFFWKKNHQSEFQVPKHTKTHTEESIDFNFLQNRITVRVLGGSFDGFRAKFELPKHLHI
ncbi:unnamed protein product [Caenorhabditis brenneri]